jgi:hypothetical protein
MPIKCEHLLGSVSYLDQSCFWFFIMIATICSSKEANEVRVSAGTALMDSGRAGKQLQYDKAPLSGAARDGENCRLSSRVLKFPANPVILFSLPCNSRSASQTAAEMSARPLWILPARGVVVRNVLPCKRVMCTEMLVVAVVLAFGPNVMATSVVS